MASEVGIANRALAIIGDDPIISFNDDNKRARVVSFRYEGVRDAVLRLHPWNCAIARAVLAKLSEAPAFGYANQFQLPADYIRLLHLNDPTTYARIEGRRLLTDAGVARIVYVRQLTDPNSMDALLREVIATRLASEIAPALAQDEETVARVLKLYDRVMIDARGADAQENPPGEINDDGWLQSRFGAGPTFRRIESV